MPNHVTHRFSVKGHAEEIKEFMKQCFSESGEFDFNSLIPMPDILKDTISGRTDEMLTEEYQSIEQEAIALTGYKNWYDWSLDNWGTKWNAYNTTLVHCQDDLLEFEFDTAWSCPEPIFEAIANKFPSLMFISHALDENFCFGAIININSGSQNIEYFDVNHSFYETFRDRF